MNMGCYTCYTDRYVWDDNNYVPSSMVYPELYNLKTDRVATRLCS